MNAVRLLPAATLAATLLLLATLAWYGANPLEYWNVVALSDALLHALCVAVLAVVLRWWQPGREVVLLAAAAGAYLAGGLGLLQSAASLLFAMSSLLLGRLLLAWMFPAQAAPATPAFFCGLALYLALFGLMIHVPVNYRGVYFALMLAPILATGRALSGLVHELAAEGARVKACAESLPYAVYTTAVAAAVLLLRLGFLPTLGFDDAALHLRLWSQLSNIHQHDFDYLAQVWEVAPFLVDLLHACINLVAGTDARGATNALLLAILLRQLWVALGSFQLAAGTRLLLLALFASTPLTADRMVTMQTELFMALLAVSGVRMVLELRGNWCSPHTAALLAVAALACATKLPGAVLGVALLAAAALQLWSTRAASAPAEGRSFLLLLGFTAVLATLAFNPYLTAWLKTGNPVFPLYNAIFESPYFPPVNFADDRWIKGFDIASYVELFFRTSSYLEARDFTAGFQYLLLFPLGLVALLLVRDLRAQALPVLVPLFGFGLAMFAATQYWRYQFPVTPLAIIVMGALLAPHYAQRGRLLVRGGVFACIALNLAFLPGISTFMDIPAGRVYTAAAKQALIEEYDPPRALTQWLNENAPGSTVLYPQDMPFGATLHGSPVYVNWYSPATAEAFAALRDEEEGSAFLRDRGIEYIIAWSRAPGAPGSRNWALRNFLTRHAEPVRQVGDFVLYRFHGKEVQYTELFRTEERFAIGTTPRLLGNFSSDDAVAFRYRAEFACESEAGYFAAQINWDIGQYYYHEIPCSAAPLQFVQALPMPAGSRGGELWARTVGTESATLTELSIETL